MSSTTFVELFGSLKNDPFRESQAFSNEIESANDAIFAAIGDEARVIEVLDGWLARYQPCLFGRIAASLGTLSHCILWESDLLGDEEHLRDKIQAARLEWTRQAFSGSKSGFVILVVSPKLAMAEPDETLKTMAQRLCSLYLLREIEPDQVYHDEIWLEKPGDQRTTWKWLAGVNYFCSNGDGRWWQDHRIPGGMALSINSVGHLVKSGILEQGMKSLDSIMGLPHQPATPSKLTSLQDALVMAMKTITKASDAVSGKATELLPLSVTSIDHGPPTACPFSLPDGLASYDPRYYKGYYHTDITIASEYFIPDVKRPSQCKAQTLEFTYLYDKSFENPDYITMGIGRQVRGPSAKQTRIQETEVAMADAPRLYAALQGSS